MTVAVLMSGSLVLLVDVDADDVNVGVGTSGVSGWGSDCRSQRPGPPGVPVVGAVL
jgi:hypothetical protein